MQSSTVGETENSLEGVVNLMLARSRLLDQPQRRNGSALSQSGRMGPPGHRGQRSAVLGGLCKWKEGGRAHAGKRVPSLISTATPRTRSCMRCAVGKEASAIPHAYTEICGRSSESADESRRSPVNPLQPLDPNPRETSEDGGAIIKANKS